MANEKDLRVIKTKKSLYEGLSQLLTEKPFENIKIKDICDRSLINRSTFYDHFSNKFDLLAAMIDERREKLNKAISINEINKDNYKEVYRSYIQKILEFIDIDINVHKNMLINNNNSIVKDVLINKLDQDITKSLEKINKSNMSTELLSKFYVTGFTEILTMHLENPTKYTKEDIMQYVDYILNK